MRRVRRDQELISVVLNGATKGSAAPLPRRESRWSAGPDRLPYFLRLGTATMLGSMVLGSFYLTIRTL
jgi:hypothetical protein